MLPRLVGLLLLRRLEAQPQHNRLHLSCKSGALLLRLLEALV